MHTWNLSLDTDWRDAQFTVIDVETTGLDLEADDIVSIGSVDIVHGWVDTSTSWYQLVRPRRIIHIEAIKTHGLTRELLASAPNIADVADALRERLRLSVPVAHAAWIERAFVDRALAPMRCRMPRGLVDTAVLAQAAGMSSMAGYEPHLESIAKALGLPVFTPHHALGDTMTTAILMITLATQLESRQGSVSVAQLARMSRRGAFGSPGRGRAPFSGTPKSLS